MIEIVYKPGFARMLKKCEHELQEEAIKKIELLRNKRNHESLKVHKLYGVLKGRYAFSVNYHIRIVFEYIDKKTLALLDIGDHEMYR